MYIRGENTQGNIAKFMAIKENTLSLNEFYRSILHEQEEDPDNFYCSFVEIASEPRIFVATEHPLRKSRGTMTTNEILAVSIYSRIPFLVLQLLSISSISTTMAISLIQMDIPQRLLSMIKLTWCSFPKQDFGMSD